MSNNFVDLVERLETSVGIEAHESVIIYHVSMWDVSNMEKALDAEKSGTLRRFPRLAFKPILQSSDTTY